MTRPRPDFAANAGRRRRFAGGTLGVTAVAVGAVVALGGTGATTAATARTDAHHSRSVVVHLRNGESIAQLNAFTAKRYHEFVVIDDKPGAATNHSPIPCRKVRGSHPKGPQIRLLAGDGNTETAAGNSGGASFHLVSCRYENVGFVSGNS